MSDRDAFDGEIERLFARPPEMNDGELFAKRIERRLAGSSRLRAVVLTCAGLLGGVFAVRAALEAGLGRGLIRISDGYSNLASSASGIRLTTVTDWLGSGAPLALSGISVAVFWLASGLMIVAAAVAGWQADQA